MVLKRKRSESEISSSSSLLSSPLSASDYMSMDSNTPTIPTPSLFSSRTRKRYRDNRPSESIIHEHTLSLLFSAQQHPLPQSHPPTNLYPPQAQAEPSYTSIPDHQSTQQKSLHSFWALPPSTTPNPNSSGHPSNSTTRPITNSTSSPFFQASNCEDCSAQLFSADNGDSMDVDMMMMDMDLPGGNHGCSKCGKQVCHSCSVSNMGADRTCLVCARPKKWQGGIGWVDV